MSDVSARDELQQWVDEVPRCVATAIRDEWLISADLARRVLAEMGEAEWKLRWKAAVELADQRTAEGDALRAELAKARYVIERIRALHNAAGARLEGFPKATEQVIYCTYCQEAAPCTTIKILNGGD